MEIFFDYKKVPADQGTVVTLGNFDGFHLGHQRIVAETLSHARNSGLSALVFTFQPHPRQLFSADLAVLTPLDRKSALLRDAGVDFLLVQPFTREFAATDPVYFVEEILLGALNCRHVVVGYDYSFGKAGSGNPELLRRLAGNFGVGCTIVPPVTWAEEVISSTAVRRFLARGQVEMAAKFMGRFYSLRGRVEAGAGRGRKLGFPTANIYPHRAAALPAWGVYLVGILVEGKRHWGVANIGRHPTFPDNRVSLEVHVLEYQGDLYGKLLEVTFYAKLRDEKQFSDPAGLQAQVNRDLELAIALLSEGDVLKLQRI
ncbi:MAG: bifunctional riboflavin kinase/FAD synthetase [Bacillota bacterium]